MEEEVLTSKLTKYIIGLYVVGIIVILFSNSSEMSKNGMDTFLTIILVVGLFCLGISIYLFLFATEAKIIHNRLVLRKTLRQEYEFSKIDIDKVSSVMRKNVKYTTVRTLKDGKKEKFIIINNLGLISFKRVDAEQKILKFLKSK